MIGLYFDNKETAAKAKDRLEKLVSRDLTAFFERVFLGNAAPDLALTNLERWLAATSSPDIYLNQLIDLGLNGKLLVTILGASQPIADTIIQNPELGSLLLESGILGHRFPIEEVMREADLLLSSATSYRHSLDRIRFLRQRWNLVIVTNDLAGSWEQEVVWQALSDLADFIIERTFRVAWEEFAAQKGLEEVPDMMVVAFGKLGGSELNYSSDIDLVYVVEDGLDEKTERDCTKFLEAYGRALSDRMGRGSLYRVDLRLRPYGGAGPILRSMRAYEAYYQLYAEPWEVQALLRSRPILGSASLQERWESVRRLHCFRPKLSEISLEQMLSMKARIEQGASEYDLKRGEGGIRDVEFLTQILQMLHGNRHSELQVRSTCEAIRLLQHQGFLEHSVAETLLSGYQFLRQLEHRTQLVGDQQTHSIPNGDHARLGLAKLMNLSSWSDLNSALEAHRRRIQTIFRTALNLDSPSDKPRSRVQQRLGSLGAAAVHWFDGLPETSAFYDGLVENRDSLQRLEKLLADAPRLVNFFKDSVSLTELLLSGEIEEINDVSSRIRKLPKDTPLDHVAGIYRHSYAILLGNWVLDGDFNLGVALSDLNDAVLCQLADQIQIEFTILGLGSYGLRSMSPNSDLDLLFLIRDRDLQPLAEKSAQRLISNFSQLKRFGAPLEVDLRLRPDGGKGLLVRTYEGLQAYDRDGMDIWERFALGQSRFVFGDEGAQRLVRKSAYGLEINAEYLDLLLGMKRRIENERVLPENVHRDVKLGEGGINDIEWLVHLNEMRYPAPSHAHANITMTQRLQSLASAELLTGTEFEILAEGYAFLQRLRTSIYLMGGDNNLLPDNPEKFDRLARASGFAKGDSLGTRHQSITESVRRLFQDGIDRLKS